MFWRSMALSLFGLVIFVEVLAFLLLRVSSGVLGFLPVPVIAFAPSLSALSALSLLFGTCDLQLDHVKVVPIVILPVNLGGEIWLNVLFLGKVYLELEVHEEFIQRVVQRHLFLDVGQ